jgi:hypothetical protein
MAGQEREARLRDDVPAIQLRRKTMDARVKPGHDA